MNQNPIQAAIDLVGSQQNLADILQCKQQTVDYWLTAGLPAKHVLKLEKALNYQITRHQFRPDLYPEPEIEV